MSGSEACYLLFSFTFQHPFSSGAMNSTYECSHETGLWARLHTTPGSHLRAWSHQGWRWQLRARPSNLKDRNTVKADVVERAGVCRCRMLLKLRTVLIIGPEPLLSLFCCHVLGWFILPRIRLPAYRTAKIWYVVPSLYIMLVVCLTLMYVTVIV
jgi:hypothetical protein